MNILKRLDDIKWYNNKYIHKIEDTMFTFLTRQEIIDYYNYLSNNSCENCEKDNIIIPNKIDDIHPTLWKFKGCSCNYFRIALANTYRENYSK